MSSQSEANNNESPITLRQHAGLMAMNADTHMGDVHAQRAQIAALIDRVTELPGELVDMILESAIRTEGLSWRLSVETSFESIVDQFFAWPATLAPEKRQMLNSRAAFLLCKTALIELPTHFTMQDSVTKLEIPKILQGHEQNRVRRLVLNLRLDNRNTAYQRELNKTLANMESIKGLFPRLEVCVLSFCFQETDTRPAFAPKMLSLLNRTTFTRMETLKVSLRKFIAAFQASGPGKRRFVRFRREHSREGGKIASSVGPLVDVMKVAAQVGCEQSAGVEGADVGHQVLDLAFRFDRVENWRNVSK